MNNNRKTYVLTDLAVGVMDEIHSSFRAIFVSDAIVAYSKTKGVIENYTVSKSKKQNNKTKILINDATSINEDVQTDNIDSKNQEPQSNFKGGTDSRFD